MPGRFSRRVSSVVLALWIMTAAGPAFLPHGETFDLACSDESWASPHPTPQIEPVHAVVGDVHCVVCHLQRAVREAAGERVRTMAMAIDARPVVDSTDVAAFGGHAGHLPARAPPSAIL